jgi:hypothetical protein
MLAHHMCCEYCLYLDKGVDNVKLEKMTSKRAYLGNVGVRNSLVIKEMA